MLNNYKLSIMCNSNYILLQKKIFPAGVDFSGNDD